MTLSLPALLTTLSLLGGAARAADNLPGCRFGRLFCLGGETAAAGEEQKEDETASITIHGLDGTPCAARTVFLMCLMCRCSR